MTPNQSFERPRLQPAAQLCRYMVYNILQTRLETWSTMTFFANKSHSFMPAISRFLGIVITMNYHDHPPPHFHVRYGSLKALMAIDTLTMLRGHLSPRVLGLVTEWAAQHQAELAENWNLAMRQQPLQTIQPLE